MKTGILALVDRAWSDRWQAEANLLSRLSARYPTVWMEPPHHWRESWRQLRERGPTLWQPDEAPDLGVYTAPTWLPMTYRPPWLARWLFARRLSAARKHLLDAGCDRIVLYIWRPKYAEALELVEHDASIYHVVDEYSFSEVDPPTSPAELSLLRSVDQVIVHSPALLEKKGSESAFTDLVPNGVCFDWFARPCDEPEDLRGVPHPRIGYCGYVKRQLDWDLIRELVARHPEASWVFVGKTSPHPELTPIIDELGAKPNVHFLGTKTTRDLARYPQHFDVCIMPYNLDGYTRYIFPLKLHEYLASGSPTIGVPIRSLMDFAEVVSLVEGADAWSSAIRRSIDEGRQPEAVRRRQDVAAEYDWARLAERVAALLDAAVSRSRAG